MKTIKQITQDLKKAILSKDKNLASFLFQSGLQQDEVEFIARLQKLGVLRCSNYDFQPQILNFLMGETEKINISQDSQVYFQSVKSLLFISRNIQALFKTLLKEVDSFEIKSYLIAIDSLFWLSSFRQQNYDNIYFTSREELASAFSLYLYHGYKKEVIRKSALNEVNEKRLNEKYYLKKLRDFNKIVVFKECEVLIDYFGYTATQSGSKVVLKAPFEKFEKSLRLGFSRYLVQEIATTFDSFWDSKEDAMSIYSFCERYYKELKDHIFEIIDKPLKRVVMRIPKAQPLIELLGSKGIFLEERAMVNQIEKNLFINFEQIDKVAVYKNLSLLDIIKLQRLFVFIFFLFVRYIDSNNLSNSSLFWRSILPVFKADELKEFLSIFFGNQKTEEIFELLTWKLEDEKIFDLQAYPFINIEEWIVLPLGILSNSNLCRNILQTTGFRFDSESFNDPIVVAMERCLKPISSIFETNLEYSFQGTKGEIDVLAVVNDCLFVFECKNSLHPCSLFELRTTYDYIQKASSQLTRFCNLWQKKPFKKYLEMKIKQDLPSQLCSCIVTGNRMFSGLREQGHSVRPIHELCNIIQTGEILFNLYDFSNKDLAKELASIKVWKEETFSAEDLLAYIQEDSLHKYYFDSMSRVERTIQLNRKFLVQESYFLDLDNFLQQLVDNFRVIEKPQDADR